MFCVLEIGSNLNWRLSYLLVSRLVSLASSKTGVDFVALAPDMLDGSVDIIKDITDAIRETACHCEV